MNEKRKHRHRPKWQFLKWLDRVGNRIDAWWDGVLTINDPCKRCSSTTFWQVHKPEEKCPRELERWCMDCRAWVLLDSYLRCEQCNGLQWHPNMRKPKNDRSGFTVVVGGLKR